MSVHVYSFGICMASVCAPADMPGEEVAREASYVHPTGLQHGWAVSGDKAFKTGEPNPCPCHDDPERRHWLLEC